MNSPISSFHLASRAALVALFLVLPCAIPADAQQRGRQEPAPRTLDDVVLDALEAQYIPGAVLAVVHGDSVLVLRAYGATALSDDAPDLEEDALFRAAAMSELLNALTATVLDATGSVPLDRPLGTRVPGLPQELRGVTIEQLLSHTAGMARQLAVPGRGGADDLGAAARGLTRFDRMTDPGLLYSYSTPGISLAALAVQVSAGRPYAQLVDTHVLRPLGMTSSALTYEAAAPRLTPGWRSTDMPGDRVAAARAGPDSAVYVPVRGLSSTARDLARLVAALLNDGVVRGERVLPEGAAARVWRVHATVPASTRQAATGMRLGTWRERPSVVVSGGSGGHSVFVQMLPAERLGVIVLTNNQSASMGRVSNYLLQTLLRLPDPPPPERSAEADEPADASELDALLEHAGPYENGSELLDILAVDGRPMLRSDDLVLEVQALGDRSYGALLDGRIGLVFRLIEDEHGRVYLWVGDRALSPEHVRRAEPARNRPGVRGA